VASLALAIGITANAALAEKADPSGPGGASPQDSELGAFAKGASTRVELKRWLTSRGTPDESTRTNFRVDRLLDGPIALLRLEVPFPDEETDFNGSPFQPHLGDIKARVGFRPFTSADLTFPSFVEATFPTADPKTLGTGKYQLGVGLRMIAKVQLPIADAAAHRSAFESQFQQVVSVAGDPDRKDINTTKLEFTLYDVWRGRYTTRLKLKPNIDWVQDGRTGAVAEVEGGMFFAQHWRTWLLFGRRVWGPENIQGTYDTRVELGLSKNF
jgi:hypothetical protein